MRTCVSYNVRRMAEIVKYAGLVQHAERELRLAGLFDKDADYGGELGKSVLELCDVFSKQGHSGFSAECALDLFSRLASWGNLSPLTSEPGEWDDMSGPSGYPLWQNKRNSKAFSEDGGKTWWLVD